MRRYLKFTLSAKEGVRRPTFERALKTFFQSGKIALWEFDHWRKGRRRRHHLALRCATPQTYERLFNVRLKPVGRRWKVSDEGVVPPELAAVFDWINIALRFSAE